MHDIQQCGMPTRSHMHDKYMFAQAEHKKNCTEQPVSGWVGGQRQKNCLNIGDANKS